MSFADEFSKAEHRALVETTAQDVFNNLKDLESQASLHASRWIWELLQNARDTALYEGHLQVRVGIKADQVTFEHNGSPFTMDQIAHLIRHGSTKYLDVKPVGRFGTGFLSTHIISKTPRISGRLEDGSHFAFVLDRTGATPKELTDSMNRSSEAFVESVGQQLADLGDHSTRYVYPVSDRVCMIAQQGVESLETYAAYVLAFNPEIESIEINRDGQRRLYRRVKTKRVRDDLLMTLVQVRSCAGDLSWLRVASAKTDKVRVAVLVLHTDGGHSILFGPQVPRLFMAFPLFGSEGFGFPGVVNSLSFNPRENRDGIYLSQDEAEYNIANKGLLEEACPLFLSLLQGCARRRWHGLHQLCKITMPPSTPGIDQQWLLSLTRTSLVEPIRGEPLLASFGGQVISPRAAWIPHGSAAVPSHLLWELAVSLAESETRLVEKSTAPAWEENVRGWAPVLDKKSAAMEESLTLDKCARMLGAFGSLERLQEALRPGHDCLVWCNKLFELLTQGGLLSLFDQFALLPDQRGILRNRKELNLDGSIHEELKDIGELLEVPVRTRLMHNGVTSAEIRKLLQVTSQKDVLTKLTGRLRDQVQKGKFSAGFRDGNIRFFAWILKNTAFEILDSFPALTQESSAKGEVPQTTTLVRDGKSETIPLAPPECWPKEARAFSDLFPARHVLSSAYHAACPAEALWAEIAAREFVRTTPIYETNDYVQDFVSDDTVSDDASHKSKEKVKTTQISFLREMMDSARKSKSKCFSLLRFLAAYVIRTDPTWQEKLSVSCECEKNHQHWRAGWLGPLKNNKWVYLEKNRSDNLTAESLARLLADAPEIVRILAEGQGPAFLAALGVSAGDFLIRSVTADEQTRVSLSKSLIQMFQAVGGDSQQINDLAEEIASHPETIDELRERQDTRRRIKQNQHVGREVEKAFKAAFETGHGLTVERCPVGSDYTVEPDNDYLDENGHEVILGIGKFFVEIKSTVGDYVRMTDVQAEKAKREAGCFVLCVVPLVNQNEPIDASTVMLRARFVIDIGTRVQPLVEAMASLEESKKGILKAGPIELEIRGETVKFKIGHQVWEGGIGFEEAVRHFGGVTETDDAEACDTPTR